MVGGVAQVGEFLPNKHEALSSNSNIVKKKKKLDFETPQAQDVEKPRSFFSHRV
jgi:hypothetical protein